MTNYFFAYKHQNKADQFINALTAAGWVLHNNPDESKFVLIDNDVYSYNRTIGELAARNVPTFIYPHAAPPSIIYDFPGFTYSQARGIFVPAIGHIDIMRAYGLPYEIDVIGWSYCKIKPFTPRESFRKILFMPIHPNNNGFLSDDDKDINARAFRAILDLRQRYKLQISVRYLKKLEQSGIAEVEGVQYIQGKPDLSIDEIDNADLVISHHTPAYLAIARGVPCVMMGEQKTPRFSTRERETYYARSWEKYKHLMIYPFDILTADDPARMFATAISGDRIIADWRRRMIGDQFDPGAFVGMIENKISAISLPVTLHTFSA